MKQPKRGRRQRGGREEQEDGGRQQRQNPLPAGRTGMLALVFLSIATMIGLYPNHREILPSMISTGQTNNPFWDPTTTKIETTPNVTETALSSIKNETTSKIETTPKVTQKVSNTKRINTPKLNRAPTRRFPTRRFPTRKFKKPIFFVHIHKSAGSLVCDHMKTNRVMAHFGENCNIQPDQRCCGNSDTMQAQIDYANTTKYDFVAIEREMYDAMATDYYTYMICLRSSQKRYFSHWKYLIALSVQAQARNKRATFGRSSWLINIPKGTDGQSLSSEYEGLTSANIGTFESWYNKQPDNWTTRIICGPKCMASNKYQISKDLFHYTLLRLDKFQHFLFVEHIEESFNYVADQYGWKHHRSNNFIHQNKFVIPQKTPSTAASATKNVTSLSLNDSTNKTNDSDNNDEKENVSDEYYWDPWMSALDDALYEFAWRKYKNDTEHLWDPFDNQEVLDEYFTKGIDRGCTDGCCGVCSQY